MATMTANLSENTTPSAREEVSTVERNALHSRDGRIGVLSHAARTLLATLIIGVGIAPPVTLAIKMEPDPSAGMNATTITLTIVCLAAFCYGMWISVISTIKRLHDLDKSGWFYLICMVPVAGSLFYLYVSLKRADDGNNEYGKRTLPSSFEERVGYLGIVLLLLLTAVSLASYFK